MVFKSKFAGFRVKVRSEAKVIHPSTGVEINKVPALICEFGQFGPEFDFTDDQTGEIHNVAVIRGHTFDTDAAASDRNWTADEKETVEAVLLSWCQRWPEAIWLHSKPKAEKPWPTYDDTHHNEIPKLAQTLGLVVEALVYEQENKARPSVIEKLREITDAAAKTAAAEESLTAA